MAKKIRFNATKVNSGSGVFVGYIFIILGFGLGTASPTLFAWTVDLSEPEKLGRGFSTMFIALEVGIGLGAFISGTMYNSTKQNFFEIFIIGSLMFLLSIIYIVWYYFKHKTIKSH